MDVSSTPTATSPAAIAGGSRLDKTTVLIVDDARSNRTHVSELLLETQLCDECLFAEDGLVAFKMLRDTPVDLVVCDLNMPRCDGLKFLRLKATDPALDSVPVIVLTGAEDRARKVQALSSGASDYVVKPFDPSELAARIRVHLKVRKLQAKLVGANRELVRLVNLDPLTDVFNRRQLMLRLDEEFLRSRRYDRPFSFVLLDIDHFKRVNDTYGHQAGDAAMVEVAAVLKATLRCHDSVARYGGEEFAVILPETPAENGVIAAERIRAAVEARTIAHEEQSIRVTASLGVAAFPHTLVDKPSDLISLADAALYDAKRCGRNRVVAAV
jgi:two-component system, cell cycle response regulator